MWTQVVGKITLGHAPPLNHSWGVAFQITPRGLTTPVLSYPRRSFSIAFDFLDHQLVVETSDGLRRFLPLASKSVADFYRELLATLADMQLTVRIWTTPVEVPDPVPFERDTLHHTYDPEHVNRWWRIVSNAHRVFSAERCRFLGKSSPVHFFWGAFDLAVTRFSGRTAPPHPGQAPNCGPHVMREAYSHEVSSCGYWPGGSVEGTYYAYAYPEPAGFSEWPAIPDGARYEDGLGEFVLPYETVRTADDPDALLLAFLQGTYEAAAEPGAWDRPRLERR
jgi:uncharacterized protein DUF5996